MQLILVNHFFNNLSLYNHNPKIEYFEKIKYQPRRFQLRPHKSIIPSGTTYSKQYGTTKQKLKAQDALCQTEPKLKLESHSNEFQINIRPKSKPKVLKYKKINEKFSITKKQNGPPIDVIESDCASTNDVPYYINLNDNKPIERPIQKPAPNTLYTALSKSKNDMCVMFNLQQPQTPINLSKQKVIECFKQNPPLNAFLSHELSKNVLHHRNPQIPLLSDKNFLHSISEQERYKRFYTELYKLRNYIEANEPQEKQIVKDFLMNNGIYNPQYYSDDKINNFLTFIKAEKIVIDPQKMFKTILQEVLINGYCKCDVVCNTTPVQSSAQKLFWKTYDNYFLQRNKIRNLFSVDKRQKIDLVHDLELQKTLYDKKHLMRHQIDLEKRPKLVIDLLKEDFVERKKRKLKGRPKNINWSNERLYGSQKQKINYNVVKKENRLTDFICLIKATNSYRANKLSGDFFLNKHSFKTPLFNKTNRNSLHVSNSSEK